MQLHVKEVEEKKQQLFAPLQNTISFTVELLFKDQFTKNANLVDVWKAELVEEIVAVVFYNMNSIVILTALKQ